MKRIMLILLLIPITGINLFSQANIKLIQGQSIINYLEKSINKPSSEIKSVEIKVEFWYESKAPTSEQQFQVVFNGISSTIDLFKPTNVTQSSSLILPSASFKTQHDTATFLVYIQLNAAEKSSEPNYFNIQLEGKNSINDPIHRVILENATNDVDNSITQIPNEKISLPPLISLNPASGRKSYHLKYKVNGKRLKDTTITLEIKNNSGNKIIPTLVSNSFIVKASKTRETETIDSVLVSFDLNTVTDFGNDEEIYVSFKGSDIYDIVRFSREKLVNPEKPFWVEIGSNFDFIDGLQPNNFFAGVFFHKRDIRRFSFLDTPKDNSIRGRNLSIFAGVYESKTISTLGSFKDSGRIYYDRNTAPLLKGDSLGIFRDTGTTKTSQQIKNIGLFFSPQIRLTNNSSNGDGFHIFASYWAEIQWQQISISQDYSQLVRKDTFGVPRTNAVFYQPLENKKIIDVKTHYQGLGISFYYRDRDVNLFANPVFGWSTQLRDTEFSDYVNNKSSISDFQLDRVWRPFYAFQFRLNEEKYGIAFSGEVRGLILKNSAPFITLALTKKFDLTKFLEFK